MLAHGYRKGDERFSLAQIGAESTYFFTFALILYPGKKPG